MWTGAYTLAGVALGLFGSFGLNAWRDSKERRLNDWVALRVVLAELEMTHATYGMALGKQKWWAAALTPRVDGWDLYRDDLARFLRKDPALWFRIARVYRFVAMDMTTREGAVAVRGPVPTLITEEESSVTTTNDELSSVMASLLELHGPTY